jgi:hypothetical protein
MRDKASLSLDADKPDDGVLPTNEDELRRLLHDVTDQLRAKRRELLGVSGC